MEAGKTGNARMSNNFDTINDVLLQESLDLIIEDAKLGYVRDKRLNIYLAGPWFDDKSLMLYDAVSSIEKMVREHSYFNVFYPKNAVSKTPKHAFINNVRHINECDIIVALVSKKDVGTAWEIGMGYALNKDIYLLGYDETTFLSHTNVMLAFTGKCFTLDRWAKFLTRGLDENDYVHIPNKWEGIE